MSLQDELRDLTPEALRDLCRNGSAREEYKKAAAEKLFEMGHVHYIKRPEVLAAAGRLPYYESEEPSSPQNGQNETAVVETEVAPVVVDEPYSGPLKASVTTATMYSEEIIPEPIKEPFKPARKKKSFLETPSGL